MRPLLEVKKLSIAFSKTPVVNSLSFSLDEGETLALVGESGSGKSLTALSLMELIDGATINGEIAFKGKRMGMIFQQVMSALNPTLNIGAQIMEGLLYHEKLSKKQALLEAKNLLNLVGIDENRHKDYPHQLSGGQKQRVMIAIALSCRPKLLICDEPTTALDSETQTQILTLLKEIQKKQGIAILFITHNLHLIAGFADRVAVMYKGEIVEIGDDLLNSPKHPYTKALLSQRKESCSNPSQDLKPLFRFEKVSHFFGKRKVLDELTLTLHEGEVLGIVGRSGSGKSTLAKLMCRLLSPTSGTLFFQDTPLENIPRRELAKNVQIIFQDPYSSLNPRMTMEDIIGEGIDILGLLFGEERKKQIRELVFQVGLNPEHLDRYPYQFSGGQRQRIGIARALAVKPKVLICDEALSSLDWTTERQILELLKEIQRKHNLTILFISHDLGVVKEISHQIVELPQYLPLSLS